jgi:uncharacterized membrane protein YfhO
MTALIPILYPTLANGGFFHLGDDMDNQMLPFLFNFREAFENGLNTYMWNFDLGTPMAVAYGYYGLGSIFFYPVFLVPERALPYAIFVIFLLKYVLACYTAFFFIKKFTGSERAAVPGAILYAFSGLQCTNLSFYIFHDVSAVFPLMLTALECMLENAGEKDGQKSFLKGGIFFALAVFINCATNYVCFIQSVVAVVIYFLFRSGKEPKTFLKGFLGALCFGTIGVGLSGVIFVPSITYMLSNARSGGGISAVLGLYDYKHILYILKGLLFPGDSMLDETVLMVHEWSSTSAYLPFVGLILVIAYIMKNRNYLTYMTLFLVLISFIPAGNGAFLAFMIVYHRWWYFLILIMALESALVLENIREYDLRIPVVAEIIMTLLVTVLIWLYREEGESLVFHRARFLLECGFAVICCCLVFFFSRIKDRKLMQRLMLGGIVLCSVVTFLFAEYLYVKATPVSPKAYENSYLAMQKVPEIEDNYRYRNYVNPLIMYGKSRNITGLSSYSSTTSNSTVEFDDLFDYYDVSRRTNKNFIPGAAELLGGRYLIRTDNFVEERYPDSVLENLGEPVETFEVQDKTWNIYELTACPVGYGVKRVITLSQLKSLPVKRRGIALLYAPVVSDDVAIEGVQVVTADEVNVLIDAHPEYANGDALFKNPCIEDLAKENSGRAVKSFNKSTDGFELETDYESNALVYLTIPYDEGWKLTIDGMYDIEPISSGGMTLIQVPAGYHRITARYHLPYLTAGSVVSICCVLILAVLTLVLRTYKKKDGNEK